MVPLIVFVLLFAASCGVVWFGWPGAVAEDLGSDAIDTPTDPDDPADDLPDTAEQAEESVLTHQLLAGSMSPSMYQRLMSELAHGGTRSGGVR